MQKKGSKKILKKSYWDMLVKEIRNQFDTEQATFHFLPRKAAHGKSTHQAYDYKYRKPIKMPYSYLPNNDQLNSPKHENHKRYQLCEPFTHIYLTQRESESIKAILAEKTIINAAQKLNLSPRTLEFYFDNVKRKLNCRKKKEVLEMVKRYKLLDF